MRKIPEEFSNEGIRLKLIKRLKNFVMYKGEFIEYPRTHSHYEIHKIRTRKASKRTFPDGREAIFPETEYLATDKEFGSYAWSYANLDQANNDWIVKTHKG